LLNSFVSVLDSGGAGGGAGSYESIATATPIGVSTITFSSIPQTYTSLQIRGLCTDTGANSVTMHINSDTGTNYARHALSGNGSTAGASGAASTSNILIGGYRSGFSSSASYLGGIIVDIHDYTSTSRYKTTRSFNGYDANGSGTVELNSGLWQSTSAVTSITISMPSNFSTGSVFSLYGIKGA
jgi:hypothetical protein